MISDQDPDDFIADADGSVLGIGWFSFQAGKDFKCLPAGTSAD
jgi:hypothetical protein